MRYIFAIVGVLCVMGLTGHAQTDPSTLPRLALSDLTYVGAFRLPPESNNGATTAWSGQAIAVNPTGPSLYVNSFLTMKVAEFTIPTPVKSVNIAALPVAAYRQGFSDPSDGTFSHVWTNGVRLGSLLVADGRLLATGYVYYDALADARFSHFSRGLALSSPSATAWSNLEWRDADTNTLVRRPGFVGGPLAAVPAEWQAKLGGSVVSGLCCVPIISRTSFGPSAFAFNPAQIGQAVVPATPLLYYPGAHPTLGAWENQGTAPNPAFNQATEVTGLVLVPGTRSALFFGRTGVGVPCYGSGTATQSLHGTKNPVDGVTWCYDPTSTAKGAHAYPYQYYIWAYDLNDFAAVKAGTKKPWEVRPYAMGPLELPIPQAQVALGGVSYDATRRTLYVAQHNADPNINEPKPIIHTLTIGAATAPTPTPDPPPPTNTTPPAPPAPPAPVLKPNYEAFTVSSVVFRIPERMFANATHCLVSTERASVRILIGSTPTATTGRPLPTSYERFFTIEEAREARIVRATSTSALVHVECPVKQ